MTGLEALQIVERDCEDLEQVPYGEFALIEKSLKALEIIKPLCEVVETPVKKIRYLKINGVVVYTFKTEEEFNLLKGILNDE